MGDILMGFERGDDTGIEHQIHLSFPTAPVVSFRANRRTFGRPAAASSSRAESGVQFDDNIRTSGPMVGCRKD
jgi:hypothetical protein